MRPARLWYRREQLGLGDDEARRHLQRSGHARILSAKPPRPWVVAAHDAISYQQATAIDDLILDLGAILVEMSPEEHDSAVSLISHVPQVVSTIRARRLSDAAGSARHLAEAVAELQALGLIDPGVGPALVPMLSGALNEVALWAAEAEDREAAVADALRGVRAWLSLLRRT